MNYDSNCSRGSPIHAGEQQSPSIVLCLVTPLSGEELRPIQAVEQQSPSAVFYSATVRTWRRNTANHSGVQSAIGLKPTVSVVACSSQFNIPTHFPDYIQCLRGGGNGRAPGAGDYVQ